jgi:hypothetical protein
MPTLKNQVALLTEELHAVDKECTEMRDRLVARLDAQRIKYACDRAGLEYLIVLAMKVGLDTANELRAEIERLKNCIENESRQ